MKTVDIMIETPRGSNLKYHFDTASRLFRLKKILPAGMMFPFDFGFVPGTTGEDGDPLDALVFSEFPGFPGCLVECRVIGGLKAKQSRAAGSASLIRNDRFFAVPILSVMYRNVKAISNLPGKMIEEIEQFFIQYNKMEGKQFSVIGKLSARQALKQIPASVQRQGEKTG